MIIYFFLVLMILLPVFPANKCLCMRGANASAGYLLTASPGYLARFGVPIQFLIFLRLVGHLFFEGFAIQIRSSFKIEVLGQVKNCSSLFCGSNGTTMSSGNLNATPLVTKQGSNLTMVPWYHGTMVPWYHDTICLLYTSPSPRDS